MFLTINLCYIVLQVTRVIPSSRRLLVVFIWKIHNFTSFVCFLNFLLLPCLFRYQIKSAYNYDWICCPIRHRYPYGLSSICGCILGKASWSFVWFQVLFYGVTNLILFGIVAIGFSSSIPAKKTWKNPGC